MVDIHTGFADLVRRKSWDGPDVLVPMTHANDPAVIEDLLTTPATWAIVGLSANKERVAYGVAEYIQHGLGMTIVPVNPRGDDAHGAAGYRKLADVPGPVDVVDCFVNSRRVGEIVDDAIAEAPRLGIRAVWLQLGVIDEAAAERAKAAGLQVVMDTCPAIEGPRLRAPTFSADD